MQKEDKKFVVEETALAKLGDFLSELPYKYKDKIDVVLGSFKSAKLVEIRPLEEKKDEAPKAE